MEKTQKPRERARMYTITARIEEIQQIKEKANELHLSVSKLMVLGALNWDGRIRE